jgi:hypothetical protein
MQVDVYLLRLPPGFHALLCCFKYCRPYFRMVLEISQSGTSSWISGGRRIRAFFWAACRAFSWILVSVFLRSASDPFPCLSCRPCLPLRLSFSCCPKHVPLAWFRCSHTRRVNINCNLAYFSQPVNCRFQDCCFREEVRIRRTSKPAPHFSRIDR